MKRRQFTFAVPASLCAAAMPFGHAFAQGLPGISDSEASQGLKSALERGALSAIQLLGRQDGFFGNPKVRIPLPGHLKDAEKFMKALGRGKEVEELELAINRAAEQAVPLARDLLVNAVKTITVSDAKKILTGGDTSVTAFFAERTREPLGVKFLPVVSSVVEKVGLAEKYNRIAGRAAGMGLVKKEDATVQQYVTRKALDGLYFMIGEEERKIRRDPVGTGSALLGKVFGALR